MCPLPPLPPNSHLLFPQRLPLLPVARVRHGSDAHDVEIPAPWQAHPLPCRLPEGGTAQVAVEGHGLLGGIRVDRPGRLMPVCEDVPVRRSPRKGPELHALEEEGQRAHVVLEVHGAGGGDVTVHREDLGAGVHLGPEPVLDLLLGGVEGLLGLEAVKVGHDEATLAQPVLLEEVEIFKSLHLQATLGVYEEDVKVADLGQVNLGRDCGAAFDEGCAAGLAEVHRHGSNRGDAAVGVALRQGADEGCFARAGGAVDDDGDRRRGWDVVIVVAGTRSFGDAAVCSGEILL